LLQVLSEKEKGGKILIILSCEGLRLLEAILEREKKEFTTEQGVYRGEKKENIGTSLQREGPPISILPSPWERSIDSGAFLLEGNRIQQVKTGGSEGGGGGKSKKETTTTDEYGIEILPRGGGFLEIVSDGVRGEGGAGLAVELGEKGGRNFEKKWSRTT